MKKSLSVISMMLVLAFTLMGCATTTDLEKVQAQEKLMMPKLTRHCRMHKLPRRQPMQPR